MVSKLPCKHGVLVWCPRMMSPYGVLVWCPRMVSSYGVPVWCPRMVSSYGVPIWCPRMVSSYGVPVNCNFCACENYILRIVHFLANSTLYVLNYCDLIFVSQWLLEKFAKIKPHAKISSNTIIIIMCVEFPCPQCEHVLVDSISVKPLLTGPHTM